MPFIKKLNIQNITWTKFFTLGIFLTVFFFIHASAQAATLSISPSGGAYGVGKTISVRVVVNSGGQSINAVSGQITFSTSTLSLVGLSKSGVVTLWAQDPTYSNATGTASFQGVILNGYTGGNGTVLTLTFKTIAAGVGAINIANGASSVLLNDGQGTNVLSSTNSASFAISGTTYKAPVPVTPVPAPTPSPIVPTTVTPTQPVSPAPQPSEGAAPLFTSYQSPLLPGNFVVVKGTAPLNSTVTVTFTRTTQNGTTTVTQTSLPATDGTFAYVSDEKVSEGNSYTLLATTPDGKSTAPLTLAVKNSLLFTLSMLIAMILAIKMSAWLALLLLFIIAGYLVYRNHMLKKHLQMLIDKLHEIPLK